MAFDAIRLAHSTLQTTAIDTRFTHAGLLAGRIRLHGPASRTSPTCVALQQALVHRAPLACALRGQRTHGWYRGDAYVVTFRAWGTLWSGGAMTPEGYEADLVLDGGLTCPDGTPVAHWRAIAALETSPEDLQAIAEEG